MKNQRTMKAPRIDTTKNIETRTILASEMKNERLGFTGMMAEAYTMTDFLNEDPKKPWHFVRFWSEYVPEILRGQANIVNAYNAYGQLVGTCIARKRIGEAKICVIYVDVPFRRQGIGTKLLAEALNWLGVSNPVIEIPQSAQGGFDFFVKRYSWKLSEILGATEAFPEVLLVYNKEKMPEPQVSSR